MPMVTHSSILAQRIPWTEEPDGLESTGSQRIGHNSSNLACVHEINLTLDQFPAREHLHFLLSFTAALFQIVTWSSNCQFIHSQSLKLAPIWHLPPQIHWVTFIMVMSDFWDAKSNGQFSMSFLNYINI